MKPDTDLRNSFLAIMFVAVLLSTCSAARAQTAIAACGTTISKAGNYVVTKNLTAAAQDCITITVKNVAIDLKGHTLAGDGKHSGITDGGNAIAYIIIANGKITGFNIGIDLSGQNAQVADQLLNLNVSDNVDDGIRLGGRDSIMYKVTASNNGADGIDGETNGDCCNDLTKVVTNNNGMDGVDLRNGKQFLVNQTATGNTDDGVFDDNIDDFIINSTANKNGEMGVDFPNSADNSPSSTSVIWTTANGNKGDGIKLGQYAQVTDGFASNNGGDGIDFSNTQGMVSNVVTNNNSSAGVLLECPGNAFRVAAQGNGTNLVEGTSGGMCTNVRNNAR